MSFKSLPFFRLPSRWLRQRLSPEIGADVASLAAGTDGRRPLAQPPAQPRLETRPKAPLKAPDELPLDVRKRAADEFLRRSVQALQRPSPAGRSLTPPKLHMPSESRVSLDHVNARHYRTFSGKGLVPRDLLRLRFQVYCIERSYLAPESCHDEIETDDFDACAQHFAAYTADNTLVGTVRLVTPRFVQAYPFEGHCSTFGDFKMPPRAISAEVSRLVVRPTLSRRRSDGTGGVVEAHCSEAALTLIRTERRSGNSPTTVLGMYREMYRHSLQNGIRYWFAAMERSLAYSLGKMGFRFQPIGPVADYFGAVTPYILDLNSVAVSLAAENPALAKWFNERAVYADERENITTARQGALD